jgi:hypothetical protein
VGSGGAEHERAAPFEGEMYPVVLQHASSLSTLGNC